ncbi:hypothetical protein E2C01_008454 [Portunus trituberculatus]|uniref:Uncharacterized protein n=1 Tax=Portunus trituberculatus TaxID=210409 RepID=A0A5B7D2W7_PORTR|nr:hypothetical protein [Portunus trituberculatus]
MTRRARQGARGRTGHGEAEGVLSGMGGRWWGRIEGGGEGEGRRRRTSGASLEVSHLERCVASGPALRQTHVSKCKKHGYRQRGGGWLSGGGGGIRPSALSGASRQQKVEAKAYKSACVIAC